MASSEQGSRKAGNFSEIPPGCYAGLPVKKAVWTILAAALASGACQPAGGPALVEVKGVLSTRLREGDVL
jgi:hypothetical protein